MSEWHIVNKEILIINVCALVGFLCETVIPPCLLRTEFDVIIHIHFVVGWEIHQDTNRCTGLNWRH